MTYPPSELILNPDGSVYHLNLLPEDLAHLVITVGDPDRVDKVSKYFDSIELRKQKREFTIHTGSLNGKRLTVMSTGMGTSNIEIVMNELDALVNIDLNTREPKSTQTSLEIVRIGTSGSLRLDVPLDGLLVTDYSVGFDGILNYYEKNTDYNASALIAKLNTSINPDNSLPIPYITRSSSQLAQKLTGSGLIKGNTATCLGFYAPQGRLLRLLGSNPAYLQGIIDFEYGDFMFHNFEMETAAILEFAARLGHHAASTNAIVANRINNTFSKDSKKTVDSLIQLVLEKLTV